MLAVLILLATIDPDLRDGGFAVPMPILGMGMELIASQLGNAVQSSVDASGRGGRRAAVHRDSNSAPPSAWRFLILDRRASAAGRQMRRGPLRVGADHDARRLRLSGTERVGCSRRVPHPTASPTAVPITAPITTSPG